MLQSGSAGDFKFPGGGVQPGEDAAAALARELDEECGRTLVELGTEALVVVERRPASDRPGAVFEMESRYYHCRVAEADRPQRLDDYEQELGLQSKWVGLSHWAYPGRRSLCPVCSARPGSVVALLASSRCLPRGRPVRTPSSTSRRRRRTGARSRGRRSGSPLVRHRERCRARRRAGTRARHRAPATSPAGVARAPARRPKSSSRRSVCIGCRSRSAPRRPCSPTPCTRIWQQDRNRSAFLATTGTSR
jgi:ADP-ribose pyrophosphatase YjhB (NUDIX family)